MSNENCNGEHDRGNLVNIIRNNLNYNLNYSNQSGILTLEENGEVIASAEIGIDKFVSAAYIRENPDGQEPGLYIVFEFEGGVEPLFLRADSIAKWYSAGRYIEITDEGIINCTMTVDDIVVDGFYTKEEVDNLINEAILGIRSDVVVTVVDEEGNPIEGVEIEYEYE